MADRKTDSSGEGVLNSAAWCRVQDAFVARSHLAIECAKRDGSSISPEELLRRMDLRLDAARREVAQRGGALAKPAPPITRR